MQYDIMGKRLLEIAGDKILNAFYGLKVVKSSIIHELPKEMVSSRSADFVIHINESLDGEYIKLLELQTEWKQEKLVSIIGYTARLKNTYPNLEIRPSMLLFKEHKDARDNYSDNALTLKMRLVRLWRVKAWRYISDSVELMPFIPLMKNGLNYVRRAENRIYKSTFERELKADLLTALFFFTGMRSKKLADRIHNRRRELMMESAAYDIVINEGKKKGERKGVLKGLRRGLIRGIEKEKLRVARELLGIGLSIESILTVTNLSREEILAYKASLGLDER